MMGRSMGDPIAEYTRRCLKCQNTFRGDAEDHCPHCPVTRFADVVAVPPPPAA